MNVRKYRKHSDRHIRMAPYDRRVALYLWLTDKRMHPNGTLPQEDSPVYVWDARHQ